jgi:hypothetical protein
MEWLRDDRCGFIYTSFCFPRLLRTACDDHKYALEEHDTNHGALKSNGLHTQGQSEMGIVWE